MNLFAARERNDLGPADWSEPAYEYLDRSARPIAGRIRDVFEEWFASYPADSQGDLRARFADRQPSQHTGALLELYICEVLRRLGHDPEIHPELSGTARRVDFGVANADGRVFVECTTCMPAATEAGAEQRRSVIIDIIATIESNRWTVAYVSRRTGPTPLSKSRFRGALEAWLAELDSGGTDEEYEDTDTLPEYEWRENGWVISLHALRLQSGAPPGDIRGAYVSEAVDVDSPRRLRSAIVNKGSSYGSDPGSPMLLVVASGLWYSRDRDLMTALLGDVL